MVRVARLLVISLCMVFFCLALAGNAAAVEIYNGSITTGDGYQLNNFVIDLTDAFPSADSASFYVYENGDEVDSFLINVGDSYEFDFEGDADVKVTLISVSSGTLPVARVSIIVNNYRVSDLFESSIVDGGNEYAIYSGTPALEIIKSVDKSEIDVGEVVRVTVTVENTGDDDAVDVVFSDAQQAKFILVDNILGEPGKIDVEKGASTKKIYVYDLKATEAGTFSLNPVTASFTNEAGLDFDDVSSNSPTVIVNAAADLVNADLEFTTTLDKYTVNRNDEIQGTIIIKNNGDAPAKAVTVDIMIPDGLEFQSGSDIEVISGVPTIYLESFGVQQEKEFTFTVKATEVGTYTLSMENSYLFDNGVDTQLEEVTSESVTNKIYVVKGEYDYLFEQPIYFYVIPLIIIGAIVGWIYHRHKQYKF
ncbi:BatD family protein [Methanolobus sediminis]|uniref:BatD family protein n=1 Tax=Methanolobus sediminis TaxID=3072978 RepID=A0AA51UPB0_9EURY|nr:BatD family protein [Methanolobus sediminis]WMW25996.1 BatD family protein [Methanolobus sediminis]